MRTFVRINSQRMLPAPSLYRGDYGGFAKTSNLSHSSPFADEAEHDKEYVRAQSQPVELDGFCGVLVDEPGNFVEDGPECVDGIADLIRLACEDLF